jgi:hypothetical protein
VVAVGTAELRGKCTKRFAQNARKNAKSLSNPEMTVRYIAKNALQNAKAAVVKRADSFGFGIRSKELKRLWSITLAIAFFV